MPEERKEVSAQRETELGGVTYCVTSHYGAAGSLTEILKKLAVEAMRTTKEPLG